MTRPILTVVCKARDLIAGSQRCEYVLTEAGERVLDDSESRLSAELDTGESR